MDPLTLFGALAVTAMLVLSALEGRSAVFGPTFAGACPASSATEPYLTGELYVSLTFAGGIHDEDEFVREDELP